MKEEKKKHLGKRVFLRTFGCQMNERDSEMISGMLISSGYDIVKEKEQADIVLLNTCSVRQHAEDRVLGNVREIARRKKQKNDLKIGVIGCMARRHKQRLFEISPEVDFIVGPNNIYELPEVIRSSFEEERTHAVDKLKRPKRKSFIPYRDDSFSAYVNIMYGCDNFCSYCIVPYVRGRETSRAKKVIMKEVRDLASRGFKQVTLLGQNVNSYGRKQTSKVSFPDLLAAANEIKGIERISFTTSHPKDASKALFRAMRDLDKVAKHIHLPLQSASDRILDLMNRGYTLTDYMRKVDLAKKMVPDLAITTDLIVGFPSEKKKDFLSTREAMEKIKFNSSFIFKYSPRTPAASSKLKDDVPESEKKRRNTELLEVQKRISRAKNTEMIGTVQRILPESKSRLSEKELIGRTHNNTPCVFPGEEKLIGEMVEVRITDTTDHTLRGERV